MPDVFQEAMDSIMEPDKDKALAVVRKHLKAGGDPLDLVNLGFIPGLSRVGELFGAGRIFLPEVMLAAEAMQAATRLLTEALPPGQNSDRGRIRITAATVKGDIHDIGKNLGIALLRANGFTVHDLGRSVDIEAMIDDAVRNGSRVIATSTLLTTTMPEQQKLEESLKKAGLKGRIMTLVAGAPVTRLWARRIGADIYAENAHEGVAGLIKALETN
jgi:trimethylamine corrinoid protein